MTAHPTSFLFASLIAAALSAQADTSRVSSGIRAPDAIPIEAPAPNAGARLEANKRLARAFYEDLWFTRNTGNYGRYVADTYVVHDTGDRKGVVEPAEEQKNIADFFWANGELSGVIDYQIAEGDLVATRWRARLEPSTLLGRFLMVNGDLPIINVFRIADGKIVEIWNHRHDIDTGQTLRFTLQGLAIGLGVALLLLGYALVLRRRLRRAAT